MLAYAVILFIPILSMCGFLDFKYKHCGYDKCVSSIAQDGKGLSWIDHACWIWQIMIIPE